MKTPAKPDAVERSYQLLALIDVCELSARYMSEFLGQKHVQRYAGSLANVMELASDIASELHDTIERSEKTEKQDA